MRDHRDLVIEALADSEAELRERDAQNVAIYRAIATAAIRALHDTRVERDRLRAAHHRLIREYRALRAQTMREAVAA